MRSYRNPFRARASEQLGDPVSFLRNFGSGVLEVMPDTVWDRPLVLRSAPGGGKTSLMRLFTLESVDIVSRRRDEFPEIAAGLSAVGALSDDGPTHAGVLLSLDRDYRSLLDIGLPSETGMQFFFRLLDARILAAVVRAVLAHTRTTDPEVFELVPDPDRPEILELAERFRVASGRSLLNQAQEIERAVITPLDSLLPITSTRTSEIFGGHELYSLRLLSACQITVQGREVPLRPLVMLDDGHQLASAQRESLLGVLSDRGLDVARWYSERFEALENEELLIGSTAGRDFEPLNLEDAASRNRRFERVALDVANRRAASYLEDYAQVQQRFTDLIDVDQHDLLEGRDGEITAALRERIRAIAAGHDRYSEWLTALDSWAGYEGATLLRALEIVIRADQARPQAALFDLPAPIEEFEQRKTRVLEAARLLLAREFSLPYYAGPDAVAKLGAENMEQFLKVTGDMFEQMLAEITLRRPPRLTPRQQDRIIRRASNQYWSEIPQRVHHGSLVRRLVTSIVELAQRDTFRDTAPYAPGVTGTALPMHDRERLIAPETRERIPGAQELYDAIASAVASNVLSIKLDYAVKNQRVMVIYLNRLLCPRFNLPLGRGGFRERRLEAMASWMTGTATVDEDSLEVQTPEQLTI